MSDPENPQNLESPEIEALLRASRADEPMPADVVARLDAVIAGLAAERASGATVVPLRRRVFRIAAAAAALALLAGGAAVASGLLNGSGDGAASRGPQAGVARSPLVPSPGAESSGGSDAGKSLQGLTDGIEAPALRRTHLRTDVLALLGGRTAARAHGDDSARSPRPVAGCSVPARVPSGAEVRSVTLDSVPAVLVVPRATGPSVVARVYSCDGRNVLARTTLASR